MSAELLLGVPEIIICSILGASIVAVWAIFTYCIVRRKKNSNSLENGEKEKKEVHPKAQSETTSPYFKHTTEEPTTNLSENKPNNAIEEKRLTPPQNGNAEDSVKITTNGYTAVVPLYANTYQQVPSPSKHYQDDRLDANNLITQSYDQGGKSPNDTTRYLTPSKENHIRISIAPNDAALLSSNKGRWRNQNNDIPQPAKDEEERLLILENQAINRVKQSENINGTSVTEYGKGMSVTDEYGGISRPPDSRNPDYVQVSREHDMRENKRRHESHGVLVAHTSQREARDSRSSWEAGSCVRKGKSGLFCGNSSPRSTNDNKANPINNLQWNPNTQYIQSDNQLQVNPYNYNSEGRHYNATNQRGGGFSSHAEHQPYQQYIPQQQHIPIHHNVPQYYNSPHERGQSEESPFTGVRQYVASTSSMDSYYRDGAPMLEPYVPIPNATNITPSHMQFSRLNSIHQEGSFRGSSGDMIQYKPIQREYNARNGMNNSSSSYAVDDGHMYSISQPKWRTSPTGQPIERGSKSKFKAGDIIRRTSFCPHILCDFGGSIGVAMDGDTMCIDYVTDDLVYYLVGGDYPVPDHIEMDGLFVKVGERQS
eukprot:Tbor_TRINITY_DN5350_c0_g1::TRINITY_DN5350_c0_g1_i2::g.4340::m.4340